MSDQRRTCLQIMADALTMWEELGRIENTKVANCTVLLEYLQHARHTCPALGRAYTMSLTALLSQPSLDCGFS